MVVLADLGSCVHRGSSCAYLEAASRVVLPAPMSSCSYTASRVLLMGEFGLHRGRRGGVPSEQVPIALGVASQRPGWRHRAGDCRARPEVTEGTCFAHPASRHRFGRSPGRQSYASRGCRRTPSRGVVWKKDGSRWYNAAE
jgi:hypothetical protein